MNRLVDMAIRLIPRPTMISRMWKSTCLLLSMRTAIFLDVTASESPSDGTLAFRLAGILCVVATETNSNAPMNMAENSRLNASDLSSPPTSSDVLSIISSEEAKAIANVALAIRLGMRGSFVVSNLEPPIRIGTLRLVRGILNVALPRFGMRIIARTPTSITNSGSSVNAVSESRFS